VELVAGQQEDLAVGNGRAAVQLHIDDRTLRWSEKLLEYGRALGSLILENDEVGLHGVDVDLAVGPNRRTHAVAAVDIGLFPLFRAGGGVKAPQPSKNVADIQAAVVQNGRSELDLQPVHLPDQLRLAVRDVQADDAAQFGGASLG